MRRLTLHLLAAAFSIGLLAPLQAKTSADLQKTDELPTIQASDLPAEGQKVYNKILSGASFSHAKDGAVFANRERILPRQTRGFYREYTVRTPGVRGRGARRLVCGGVVPAQPEACYFTADHYASFHKVLPTQ